MREVRPRRGTALVASTTRDALVLVRLVWSMTDDPGFGPPRTDEEVTSFYGEHFLRYVLNGQPFGEVSSGPSFHNHSRSVLAAVLDGASQEHGALNQRVQVLYTLGIVQANGLNVAQSLRVGNGGTLPEVETNDALVAPLTRLALATFPLLHIPLVESDGWPNRSMDISLLINSHPDYQTTMEALLSDGDIGSFFPSAGGRLPTDTETLYGLTMSAVWSTGVAGGLQLVMLPAAILDYIRLQVRLGGHDEASPEAAVAETVALMRQVSRTKRAPAPVVIGLGNVRVPSGQAVRLAGGTLLPREDLDEVALGVSEQTSSFLVLDAELGLFDVLGAEDLEHRGDRPAVFSRLEHRRPLIDAAARALDREVVRARLAIALASPDDKRTAPVVRYRWTPNPFLLGSGWSGLTASLQVFEEWTIDGADAIRVRDWSQRLASLPDSMWLGARRLVGAMAERIDPLDAFVDAVVCWENLFGAETEVSFRVSAALATLLEPQRPMERAALFAEVRELYNVRSGLVHGSREPSELKAAQFRERAIELALAAMRAVFDRPDLLEAKNASERNRRLLIGA